MTFADIAAEESRPDPRGARYIPANRPASHSAHNVSPTLSYVAFALYGVVFLLALAGKLVIIALYVSLWWFYTIKIKLFFFQNNNTKTKTNTNPK